MKQSLLFLPDISGFTEFVRSTEIEHSQHVVAELLEILIGANELGLKLAEVEGDALFFYLEDEVPSVDKLLDQVERMFTAFHSHLHLLREHRICPCDACATAPNLELKIIAHCGEVQFLNVGGSRKPFGPAVIEAHRLMKNSVNSHSYALISKKLFELMPPATGLSNELFDFMEGEDRYDGELLAYLYSQLDSGQLEIRPHEPLYKIELERSPCNSIRMEFETSARNLYELITNYRYRPLWMQGVDAHQYQENEVTRIGTLHTCVISSKSLNFTAVTKQGADDELVYGELTRSAPIAEELYQFFIVKSLSDRRSQITVEQYLLTKSPIKKLLKFLVTKKKMKEVMTVQLVNLQKLIKEAPDGLPVG